MKLGIGVVTYKRKDKLARCLDSLAQNTVTPHVTVVADDGSNDGTEELVSDRGLIFITGKNRGVAWNKNRALYYLHVVERCDVVIILEDDTFVVEMGWEVPWIENSLRHGHINLIYENVYGTIVRGDGSVEDPYQSWVLGGVCSAFSAEAINAVGYFDTRFRKYGYEHVEHTYRFIKSGYGGVQATAERGLHYYVLKSPVKFDLDESHQTAEALAHNRIVFEAILHENPYRPAWQSKKQKRILRREIEAACHRGTWMATFHPWLCAATSIVAAPYRERNAPRGGR